MKFPFEMVPNFPYKSWEPILQVVATSKVSKVFSDPKNERIRDP